MFIRIAKSFCSAMVDEPLVNLLINHRQISTDPLAKLAGTKYFLKKHAPLFTNAYKSKLNQHIGDLYCILCKTRRGRRYFFKALGFDKANLDLWASVAVSLCGARQFRRYRAGRS